MASATALASVSAAVLVSFIVVGDSGCQGGCLRIDTSGYDVSCQKDTDCVTVYSGSICANYGCLCGGNAAINVSGQDSYETAYSSALSSVPNNGPACSCPAVAAACVAGICTSCDQSSGGCAGSNEGGEDATTSEAGSDSASTTEAGPEASAPLAPPMAVSVGGSFTCALLEGGAVACWGANGQGQLGDGTSSGPQTCYGAACSPTPVAVSGLTGATAISAGGAHACALLAGGTVACWGWNGYGQLGDGTSSGPQICANVGSTGSPQCSTTPVAVSGLTGATAIAAGYENTCALLAGGTVACWGDNSIGELGDGTTNGPQTCNGGINSGACSPTPVAVAGLTDATAISAGYQYACALLAGGTVACWGWNGYGQVGIDGPTAPGPEMGPDMCSYGGVGGTPTTSSCSTTPVMVQGVTGATAISAGGYFACALVSGGAVMCWGFEAAGSSAMAVPGLTGAIAVSAGWDDTCVLLAGGAVACWGDNSYGELGDGTTTGPQTCPDGNQTPTPCSPTPVAVPGLTGVTGISVGFVRTCAQLSGGTVMCWGWNDDGLLGDGTTSGPQTCWGGNSCSPTPVEVVSL